MKYGLLVVALAGFVGLACLGTRAEPPVAETVRVLINAPESTFDLGDVKVALDRVIEPETDQQQILAALDRMAGTIRRMLATLPADVAAKDIEKLTALRAFLYRKGHWNGGWPFQYDLEDPFGRNLGAKLLATYLNTRKGNCVSMPILFAILGERLGLDVTLSTAPLHILVKFTDRQTGKTVNLEPTSGGGATRLAWYQDKLPMTKAALANGVYMKTLSVRESRAVMATLALEHLLARRRHEAAIAVADVILKAYPAYGYVLAKKGTAYYGLLHERFITKYPTEADIPADKRPAALALYRKNRAAFAQAEALGWRQLADE